MVEKNYDSNFESFLSSENVLYLEQLQKKHLTNNFEMEHSWKEYFAALKSVELDESDIEHSPTWLRSDWPPSPEGEFISAIDGQWNSQESDDLKGKIQAKSIENNA